MVYHDTKLQFNEKDLHHMMAGGSIKIERRHIGEGHPIRMLGGQMKKLENITNGTQKHMMLKMSHPQMKHNIQYFKGSGIFDGFKNFFTRSIPDFFTKTIPKAAISAVDFIKKPSNALGLASTLAGFVPGVGTALSTGLKVGTVAAKLAGHGMKEKMAAMRAKKKEKKAPAFSKTKGGSLYNVDTFTAPTGALYNQEVFNHNNGKLYNNMEFNGGSIDTALCGMGFTPAHVQYMHGSGKFKDFFNKGRKYLVQLIKEKGPALIREYGPGLAKFFIDQALGTGKPPGFSPPTYAALLPKPMAMNIATNMTGSGVFSDLNEAMKMYIRKKVGGKGKGKVPFSSSHGGNLMRIGQV